jgi:putative endopeptidase
MTPPTVNAYYNSSMNEIVFPAGILQPPFYDPNRDDAMNYGGIGAVIGHEMTHGFDDQGAKFDAQGNLKNWWTAEDLANFKARGDCIQKQFDSFEVEPGLHENGKLVEGESIADLGGLTIAYAALQKSMEGKPAPPEIDGFTPEQRLFLAFAQIWAGSERAEYARMIVATNPHPLNRFRPGDAAQIHRWYARRRCAAEFGDVCWTQVARPDRQVFLPLRPWRTKARDTDAQANTLSGFGICQHRRGDQ